MNSGFKKIVLINGHLEPAHIQVLRDACATIKEKTGKRVCFPDNTRRRWVGTLSEEFQSGDCHAGQYETSLVLAGRPDLVKTDQASSLPAVEVGLLEKMKAGVGTFVEFGPGSVLSGMVKRITSDARVTAVGDMDSIQALLNPPSEG